MLATARESSPDLLVNLTSDVWFGDSPAAELHLALATFRAVEHRRQLLRVSHDGVTALVEPTGELSLRLERRVAAAEAARVRWLDGSTPFSMLGDKPWWLVTILVAAVVLSRPRQLVPPTRQARRSS